MGDFEESMFDLFVLDCNLGGLQCMQIYGMCACSQNFKKAATKSLLEKDNGSVDTVHRLE